MEGCIELCSAMGVGRCGHVARNLFMMLPCLGVVRNDSHVDNHVIAKVLIPCDKSVASIVFKADPLGGAFVKTIEVLDSGDNGIRRIMRKDLYSHRQSCSTASASIEQQLESDVLWGRCGWREAVMHGAVGLIALRRPKKLILGGHTAGHS